MFNYRFILLFLTLFVCLLLPALGGAQTPAYLDSAFAPVVESFGSSVNVVAKQADGKVLVGGYFYVANDKIRYGLARFNADGTLDTAFNPNIGIYPVGVRAIAIQPDGKILVGGLFDFNISAQRNLVRLNPDGSEDTSFTGRANSAVYALVVQPDGKILVGGTFTSVNSITRFGSARLNSNGTLDTSFTFANRTVFAIALQPDGSVLLGGNFFSTSPVYTRIVRVSSTGALDTSFNQNASADNSVRTIKLQTDGKILIGGAFSAINNVFHNTLARLNNDGTLDGSFNPSVTAFALTSMESIDVDAAGRILIGGLFTGINGSSRSNVARLNGDGSLDSTFSHQSGAGAIVRSVVAESDGNSLIGGEFQSFDGAPKYRIARLGQSGGLISSFIANAYVNGIIQKLKIQPDGKIIAAGSFFYVNGASYPGITRFLPDGTIDPSFAAFSQSQFYADPVEDIDIQPDGKIIISGFIQFANNPTLYGIIRLNSNGTVDNSFTPVTFSGNHPTAVKVLPDGKILAGGNFTALNGISRKGLARINSNGSVDNAFNPIFGSTAEIRKIDVRSDGRIIICGSFSTINGTTRNNLAQLNQDGTVDTTFTANTSSTVFSFTRLQDEKLLITGSFSSVNGTPRNRIAKLLADGQIDTSFNVDPTFNFPSYTIKTYIDGRIIVTGQGTFSPATYQLIALNPNGSTNSILASNQGFNNGIFDFEAQADGKIIFGGRFTQVSSQPRFGLARFNSLNFSRKTIFDFDGDGKSDISIFRPSVGEWWYLKSSNGGNAAFQFGNSADKIVPADFTGDGKTDVAIFRPSTGEWFILRSEDLSYYSFPFGTVGDIPAPGDFDGDGKADAAVFRPSDTTWYVRRSSDGGFTIQQFGIAGDVPVVSDYDADGKSDIAIWRASVGEWWIQKSSNSTVIAFQFGNSSDKPVQGDYTGDGKADMAIWRSSTGEWFILRSEDYSYYSFPFGTIGDVPVTGDYDGDGKADAAVFRPSDSNWYIQRTTTGILIQRFGITGDQPVPSAFAP